MHSSRQRGKFQRQDEAKGWEVEKIHRVRLAREKKDPSFPAVDGRNAAPPNMYETQLIIWHLTYQLVQDFFHQFRQRIICIYICYVYLFMSPI